MGLKVLNFFILYVWGWNLSIKNHDLSVKGPGERQRQSHWE
jgi:hypothetical protein